MRLNGIDFTSVQRQSPLEAEQTSIPELQPIDDQQYSAPEEQSYSTPGSEHKHNR